MTDAQIYIAPVALQSDGLFWFRDRKERIICCEI